MRKWFPSIGWGQMKYAVRRARWPFPVGLMVLLFAGCVDRHGRGGEEFLTYNASDGVRSLDPGKATDLESIWIVDQLYEGLLELDANLELQPALADKWTVSEDGLNYAFHIRNGARFHNGDPVSARDVVDSFRRLLDPEKALPGRWVLADLRADGGMEALAEDSLILRLSRPVPVFASLLATPQASVLRGGGWQGTPDTREYGSGPFVLKGWIPETAMVLHRFEQYWMHDEKGQRLPYLDGVRIEFNREQGAEFLGFKQDKYDFVSALDPQWAGAMRHDDGSWKEEWDGRIREYRVPYLKTDYIGVLMDTVALRAGGFEMPSVQIRQALSLALDREALVRELRAGEAQVAMGFVPPGIPGFGPVQRPRHPHLQFNPDRARELLAMAGIGPEPPLMRLGGLVLGTKPGMADLAAALQYMWSDFGVDVTIDVAPSAMDAERVAKSQVPLFRKSWLADYPDAENFLGLFHPDRWCPDGPNYTHFSRQSVSEKLNAAAEMPASNARTELLRLAETEVLEAMPVIPLWHDEVVHLVSEKWTGWAVSPTNRLDLRRVRRSGN